MTLKTLLPDKIEKLPVASEVAQSLSIEALGEKFNQLIDRVEELSEGVEGNTKNYIEPSKGEWVNLKETLLEYLITLKKEAWFRKDIKTIQSYEQALRDVEAIINKLLS